MATQVGADTRNTQYSVQVFLYDKKSKFTAAKVSGETVFLAHLIRISEILPWDRKSYLSHAILLKTSSNVIM